jgi:hypothetical protein
MDRYDLIKDRLPDISETLEHPVCQYLSEINAYLERIAAAIEALAKQERKRTSTPSQDVGEPIDLLAKWHEGGQS